MERLSLKNLFMPFQIGCQTTTMTMTMLPSTTTTPLPPPLPTKCPPRHSETLLLAPRRVRVRHPQSRPRHRHPLHPQRVPTAAGPGLHRHVVVEFDNVRFRYRTQPDTKGLKGLSFKLKKGTTAAIVGTTGEGTGPNSISHSCRNCSPISLAPPHCHFLPLPSHASHLSHIPPGKTTVSRLLLRLYDVLGGSVRINGADSRSLKQRSLRAAIGVVPQNDSLFNDTLRNNIKYGRQDATDEEIRQVIEDAQLKPFLDSLPEGWDTMVGDRGLKLSGGEQQRTSIARWLLKSPSIVVLDEATSALDTVTEYSIQEALDRLGNDRTVLVIAHRLGTIKGADNIIVLGDGKVAEEGNHDELLALGGKYAEMWNMQLTSTSGKRSTGSLTGLITD
mmetsp:Transcript_19408/g.31419  ORF Transcript_19408/g.31419 Transcript_19408/m.31419 type:complete len:390 (-) Transcript_19408:91-1260(-)